MTTKGKYCAQCAAEVPGREAYGDEDLKSLKDHPSYFLMAECLGCRGWAIDVNGRCNGLSCDKHDTRPWWLKRVWLPLKWKCEHLWDWIRYHTTRRYHILDLRVKGVYAYGWRDVDVQLLFACFNLFTSFVKGEKGLSDIEFQVTAWKQHIVDNDLQKHGWSDENLHLRLAEAEHDWKEASELWAWWQAYPSRVKAIDDGDCNYEDLQKEEDAMLVRLVAIRHRLWT